MPEKMQIPIYKGKKQEYNTDRSLTTLLPGKGD